jgi:hypothetical protein
VFTGISRDEKPKRDSGAGMLCVGKPSDPPKSDLRVDHRQRHRQPHRRQLRRRGRALAPPGPAAAPLRLLLDREPVAAPDGPGHGAIAVPTLAFAPVTRAMPSVRLGPAGEATFRPPASRGEGAAFVLSMRSVRRVKGPCVRAVVSDGHSSKAPTFLASLPAGALVRSPCCHLRLRL